jgi:hypothetical protein
MINTKETKKVKFGDWFVWEDHDGYIQYAVDDSADIAVVINAILSDNNKMKEHNFKDHGHVNGIHLYTFMNDEYIFFCHYTYADEHQAYLFRHQNMS